MKKILILILFFSLSVFSQKNSNAFRNGEFLKLNLTYGFMSAGYATFEVNELEKGSLKLFHVIGNGWSTGMTNFFFHVEDNYQTYFDKYTFQPYYFIRKIDEGGHTKDREIYFDSENNQAVVEDNKHNTQKIYTIPKGIQDMLSSLYYLRNMDFDNFKEGDTFSIKIFYDDSVNELKLFFKRREIIKTKFGKVKTFVLKPQVETGRIFSDGEGVSIWLTDDKNKIPVKVKASVLVGSIKAELIEYKGLANEFPIIFN